MEEPPPRHATDQDKEHESQVEMSSLERGKQAALCSKFSGGCAPPQSATDAELSTYSAHISTSAPSSMTRSGGMRKNSVGRVARRRRLE